MDLCRELLCGKMLGLLVWIFDWRIEFLFLYWVDGFGLGLLDWMIFDIGFL